MKQKWVWFEEAGFPKITINYHWLQEIFPSLYDGQRLMNIVDRDG